MRLTIKDIVMKFGGVTALDNVSFDIRQGEILGLIGPNGSGKTTLFNCLTRHYTPNSGSIMYNDKSLLKKAPHQIIRTGISRTFQHVALYDYLDSLDNVKVGAHSVFQSSFLSKIVKTKAVVQEEDEIEKQAYEMLDYLNLNHISKDIVASLSFKERKQVEFARALVSKPDILLLDEPAGGLTMREVQEFKELLQRVRSDFNTTIVLVEHHLGLVMSVSDRVVALNSGQLIAEGTPDEVQHNPKVIECYLGG